MTVSPSISFIGIIGKANNPLHVAIFPTNNPNVPIPPPKAATPQKPTYLLTPLSISLLLSTTLDIFESRARASTLASSPQTSDYGLLKAVDERLSIYGFETNTGVKFVLGVDIRGRLDPSDKSGASRGSTNGGLGVRDQEVKVVFRAIQKAYVALLQNPFYDPDEHSPTTGRGGKSIESRKFTNEIKRIGDEWRVGMTAL